MLELPVELLVLILTLLSQVDASRFISTCKRLRRLRRYYPWVMNETQFMRASYAAEILYLRPACDSAHGALLSKLESPKILRRVRSLHISRALDVRRVLPQTSIHTIYYYGNRGTLPTEWPKHLRTLVLRDIVTTSVTGDFSHLRTFSCNNSRMRELPTMPQLRALYARHTNLKAIPTLPELQRLNISHTAVECVPELTKLTHLDISYTLTTSIPDSLICLEHLNISSSQVSKLSATHRRLRVLKAMNTELQSIPRFPELEILYVQGSPMTTIPHLPKLSKTDMKLFAEAGVIPKRSSLGRVCSATIAG